MFCGLFCRQPTLLAHERAQAETLLAALMPHHTPDRTGTWQDHRFLLVQASTFNTPESHGEQLPHRCPRTGRLIAAWARLDNRTELMEALKPESPADSMTDPALILAAFNAWGADCVDRLEGDFAFVILDPRQGEIFAGRDALGVKPLYYFLNEHLFAFATAAPPLHRIIGIDNSVDEAWLAQYPAQLSMSFDRTPWRQIYKLAPAHHLHVSATSQRLQRYHQFVDDAPWATRRDPQWVDRYRQQLDAAVTDRLRSRYTLGCESSGGLDSSSVLALAAQGSSAGRLHGFSFAHCLDEPRHILSTSQHVGVHLNHVITKRQTPDLALIDRTFDVLGYPLELGFGLPNAPIYALCRQFGIRTMFSGFGGDEVVTNTGHLLFTELWHRRAWTALWRSLPGTWPVRGLRLLRQWHHQRRPLRHNPRFLAAYSARLTQSILRDDVIARHHLQEAAKAYSRYDAGHSSINRFILDDRLAAPVPTRLEGYTLVAASHGIDYRWPLLDRRLIQQYLSTPAIEKFGPPDRYLHRRAMANLLPEDVVWKGKSMGPILPTTLRQEEDHAAMMRLIPPNALHPALEAIVDTKKLKESLKLTFSLLTHEKRNELHRLALAQRWLERYH